MICLGLKKAEVFFHAIFYRCFVYTQKLTGLAPNTRYYYQVGVPDNGTSEVMSFLTKEGNLVFAVSFQPTKILSERHVHRHHRSRQG